MSEITKLKTAGIVTILGVAQTPRRKLLQVKVSERGLAGNRLVYIVEVTRPSTRASLR